MIITIDGPVASGKSSVARKIAQHCSFYYLNTGLLYRAFAYILLQECALEEVQFGFSCIDRFISLIQEKLPFQYYYNKSDGEQIFLNNENITVALKDSSIDKASSIISAHPHIREAVLEYQRQFARTNNIVVDGRDTGSVVFPQAEYKFFLTASLEVRASRWQKDQEKRGNFFTLEQSIEQVSARDKKDKERRYSPLVVPENAYVIDSTNKSLQEVINIILSIVCL